MPPTLVALCWEMAWWQRGVADSLLLLLQLYLTLIKVLVHTTKCTNPRVEEGQYFACSHGHHRSVSTKGLSWALLSTGHCGLLQETLKVPKQRAE